MPTNARRLLARLEPRSLPPLGDSKPPRSNIGTAPDARLHAPPRTPEWRRTERALVLLRSGVKGEPGLSRIHGGAPTRSTRDPEATENSDIAAALAFAVRREEAGDASPAARRRQLAVNVYLFRNWPSFAEQHLGSMQAWSRAVIARVFAAAEQAGLDWVRRAKANKQRAEIMRRIADTAIDEFAHPDLCAGCGGYGLEQTGVRAGMSCAKCGGAGAVQWSARERRAALRVRDEDLRKVWEPPYLALLDRMLELEREGAALHARALG